MKPLVLLLAATALVYSSLATAGFVYEDRHLVALDTDASSLAPRGLANLTYRANAWAGHGPGGYHLTNLALHLVNGSLLWAVLVPAGGVAALIGTALFLLHPIQSEAVSYIAARPDLLLATCVLLVLLAAQGAPTVWRIAAVTIAGLCAVWAKESGVVVVGLLLLWVNGRWSWRWAVPVAIWSACGIMVAYRLFHVSATAGAAPWSAVQLYTSPAPHAGFWFVAGQAAALWRLLALIVWPVGLSIDHDFDVVAPVVAMTALAALVLVTGAAWRALARCPLVWQAVAFLLMSLSLRFVIPTPQYVTEPQLYEPLLGIWIALAGTGAALYARAGVLTDGRKHEDLRQPRT